MDRKLVEVPDYYITDQEKLDYINRLIEIEDEKDGVNMFYIYRLYITREYYLRQIERKNKK